MKRISAAWQVLFGKKYWLFTQYNGKYLQHVSGGWKADEAKRAALSIYKTMTKAVEERQQTVNVEEANKIANP